MFLKFKVKKAELSNIASDEVITIIDYKTIISKILSNYFAYIYRYIHKKY